MASPWWAIEYEPGADGLAVPCLGGVELPEMAVITVLLGGGEVVGRIGRQPGRQAVLCVSYTAPNGSDLGTQLNLRIPPGVVARVGGAVAQRPVGAEDLRGPAPSAIREALAQQTQGEAWAVAPDGSREPLGEYLARQDREATAALVEATAFLTGAVLGEGGPDAS